MRLLPILAILFLLPLTLSMDLCHDPRTLDLNRSCPAPSFALQIPSVHGNTYHALHDTLWAVSHYLLHCARHPLTVYVPTHQNLFHCEDPNHGVHPDWGFCVAYILAKAVGATVNTSLVGSEQIGIGRGGMCHSTATVLRREVEGWPQSFRGLNWFVDHEDGRGHVRLEDGVAGEAFRHIRSVVRRFYRVGEGSGDVVNVLVYDRTDTRRRIWTNAKDVVEKLRGMAGVRVRYIERIPHGLGRQARLFGRTDVLIAPHGAAMANTVLMREGSAVVEIWKECREDWVRGKGSEWTGWHARHVGLRHLYVACEGLTWNNITNLTHRVNGGSVAAAVEMVKAIRRGGVKVRTRWERRRRRELEMKVLMMPPVLVAVLALLRVRAVARRRLKARMGKPDA